MCVVPCVVSCDDLSATSTRRWEVWRWLTYGLVHAGYIHILSNILVQLVLGIPLEVSGNRYWQRMRAWVVGRSRGGLRVGKAGKIAKLSHN